MDREHAFPRRKQGAQGRAARGSQPAPPIRAGDPLRGIATREALDVARYVADLSAQLEAMAIAADLDLLAYFIGMAKAEAEMFVRTNTEAEASDEPGVLHYEGGGGPSFD